MSNNKERQEGFYWVKISQDTPWTIGEYYSNTWYVIGLNLTMQDTDFAEIDERRIERAEGITVYDHTEADIKELEKIRDMVISKGFEHKDVQ